MNSTTMIIEPFLIESIGNFCEVTKINGLYYVAFAPANADGSFDEDSFVCAGGWDDSVFGHIEQVEWYIDMLEKYGNTYDTDDLIEKARLYNERY